MESRRHRKPEKQYNLIKERPQVILIGNGPFRSSGVEWDSFIKSVAIKDINNYWNPDTNTYALPSTLLTTVTSDEDDIVRHNKYYNALSDYKGQPNEFSRKLVDMPVDAIITTNYTYEIEQSIIPSYNGKGNYYENTQTDKKYLIHTYNQMSADCPQIWHMHGEKRNKTSLILSHDEYVRLITKILNYLQKAGRYSDKIAEFQVRSWIDYFIIADMYIVGQGLDYSEFDLWWLLNRRRKETDPNVVGSVVFYEPKIERQHYKIQALVDLDVIPNDLGFVISDSLYPTEQNNLFEEFYLAVLDDIRGKVNKDI